MQLFYAIWVATALFLRFVRLCVHPSVRAMVEAFSDQLAVDLWFCIWILCIELMLLQRHRCYNYAMLQISWASSTKSQYDVTVSLWTRVPGCRHFKTTAATPTASSDCNKCIVDWKHGTWRGQSSVKRHEYHQSSSPSRQDQSSCWRCCENGRP